MSRTSDNPALPSLAGAEWLMRPQTQAVLAALRAAGFEARVVGGAVRNALLGVPVADIDIATPAEPRRVLAAMTAAGLHAIPTGIEHGTVTAISGHSPYEVTTLRRDVATDGRRAVVAFTDDWVQDARRRDFTINALYCDAEGVVFDPLGGHGDLIVRRVRFIGDAGERIREDYLRILRFFRLHAVYGAGAPDRAGLLAVERNRDGLARLSAERVRAEMLRIAGAQGAVVAIQAMLAHGILSFVLGVAPRPGVLTALVAAEDRLFLPADPLLRLSALALATEEDKQRLAGRLRLSSAEQRRLLLFDPAWGRRMATAEGAERRRTLYRLGAAGWRRRVLAALALDPGLAALTDLYPLPDQWPPPTLPVAGRHVLAHGIPPGPVVGQILSDLEVWWIANDFPPEDQVRAALDTLARDRKGIC